MGYLWSCRSNCIITWYNLSFRHVDIRQDNEVVNTIIWENSILFDLQGGGLPSILQVITKGFKQ
jgi:hypothetical protein